MVKNFRNAFPVIILVLIFGCNTAEKEAERSAMIDSLSIEYTEILDSIDHTWTVMIEDDDEKLLYMKRLLKEVEYTQNYDIAYHERMDSMITALQESRYDQLSMADSESIDIYDMTTSTISTDIIKYAQDHPDYERYPLMEELVQDIRNKNHDILMFRVDYDQSARLYNKFVSENSEYMNQIDSNYIEILPLFALEN